MKLSPEFEQQIHEKLMRGDPTATSDLADACAHDLRRWLQGQIPGVRDPHLYSDAATDAILNYGEHPEKFDPTRASLSTYLSMSAKRDLLNALQREQRRKGKEVIFSDLVEDGDSGRNKKVEEIVSPHTGRNEEEAALIISLDRQKFLKEFLSTVPDNELDAVRQWLDGVRETSAFVPLLGLEGLNKRERERAVKRFKDRYTQQLKRWAPQRRKPNAVQ